MQLSVLNDTGGRISSRRQCLRRIRVLGVYGDFALAEVQAKGRGSWREALEFELLGAQFRGYEEPVSPCPPGARVCGCVICGDDVALCDEGRRLWSEALRDCGARAGYEEHMARVLAG